MDRPNLGPVFWWELRRVSRSWGLYALRALLVAGLLVGLSAVWWKEVSQLDLSRPSRMARAGEEYFVVIVLAQLSTVLLAVPAATAGAFSTAIARGQVCLMLASGVTAAEIVLGTLAARLLPVLGTTACVVPVLALTAPLGGIAPQELVRLEVVTVGSAVLGCTLALLLSIGAPRLHEVLVATYVLLLGWVLGYPILLSIQLTTLGRWLPRGMVHWFLDVNPYVLVLGSVFSPGSVPPGGAWDFLAGTLGLALALAGLAAWRLRSAALADAERPLRRSWTSRLASRWPGASLDSHPVFWRECRLRRRSRWLRLLWGLYVAGAMLFTALAVSESATRLARTPWPGLFNGFQAAVGLGLLSLVTPAALAEDRARGSLEVLLSTPLSSRSLVLDKWCAYYRIVPALALLPALLATAYAVQSKRWLGVVLVSGLILSHGAAVTSLGLALATWVSRLERALILSVAASVLVTVVWVPLVAFLIPNRDLALGLASASPMLGIAVITVEMILAAPSEWPMRVYWAQFWIVAYSGLALILLRATLASFDRCLGRITPAGARRRLTSKSPPP
jgi:ABC-type transport system involved in multi-copper enzyme maturation permease subunit